MKISIITTASIPWMTGSSVNPTVRAAALSDLGHDVTLYLPWIEKKYQSKLFADNSIFNNKDEQILYIKSWLEAENLSSNIDIEFYQSRYSNLFQGIYPKRSIFKTVKSSSDLLIIEEPEHILFFQPFSYLKNKIPLVWGVIITNYSSYYTFDRLGKIVVRLYKRYDRWLKLRLTNIIRLSTALEAPSNCKTVNINGALPKFFKINSSHIEDPTENTLYFIGKYEIYKGFKELGNLWQNLPHNIKRETIDCYGGGDNSKIERYCAERGLKLNCYAPTVSPEKDLSRYKTFINCSRTEGLCTTSMDALAMGKWLIIPRTSCNEFFYPFTNSLVYNNQSEFLKHLEYSINNTPSPLPQREKEILSFNSATKRFINCIASNSNSNH